MVPYPQHPHSLLRPLLARQLHSNRQQQNPQYQNRFPPRQNLQLSLSMPPLFISRVVSPVMEPVRQEHAFGSAVAKRIGDMRFLYFSTLCGVSGALTYLVFHFGGLAPMVGASAAISGQMAGALRFFFNMRWGVPGAEPPDVRQVPLTSLGETFKDRRIVLFLIIWVVLNAIFGLIPQPIVGAGGGIAWEAHIGGFLCGLFSFGLFDRASLGTPRPLQAR